jgi:hypothetical protein
VRLHRGAVLHVDGEAAALPPHGDDLALPELDALVALDAGAGRLEDLRR